MCVNYRLRGEEECLEVRDLISECVGEIRKAMLNSLQKESQSNFNAQNQDHTFGYTMPGESVNESGLDAMEHILAHAKACSYRRGDEILRRGCTQRRLFHITSGTAACTSANGQVTARMGPGEVFGDSEFLDTGDCGAEATVVAEEATECLVVARETVEMLASLHVEAGARFWRSLAVSAALRLRGQYVALQARSGMEK